LLHAALRDLVWRRRRFLIALVGAALVFAVSLLMSGLSESFPHEDDRTLALIGADGYILQQGVGGPFTSSTPVPDVLASQIAALPGVERADPFLTVHGTVKRRGAPLDVTVFGVVRGGLGSPPIRKGQLFSRPGDAVVSGTLGYRVGDAFAIDGHAFTVTGKTTGVTLLGGSPIVFVSLADLQQAVFDGQPLASAILTRGLPANVPQGYESVGRSGARADLLRSFRNARAAIDLVKVLMWIVAALIVGSVVYLSALERTRDFAVFKATGSSTASIGAGLALQAVVIALAAALLAALVATLLTPVFPLPVVIPTSAYLHLPVVAVGVGLLASLAGLRRMTSVEPAAAFGGP
jgi:putative ABC transport system permease protein